MYLSEYQHNKLHATWGEAGLAQFQKEDGTMPVMETKELAIQSMQIQMGKYKMDYPIRMDEILEDMIRETLEKLTETEKQDVYNEIFTLTEESTKELVDNHAIVPIYYFGDNTLFLLFYFDTRHPLVKALLRKDERITRTRFFLHVLVLRYPVLRPLNMEKTMINIRYKYFMRYTTNPDKWRLWLKGKWHIRAAAPSEPEQFQADPEPETIDPLAWVQEEDYVSKRKVYSMRYLESLPPRATWASMSASNRRLSSSYYVNNIEDDQDIVYELADLDEPVWDTVQQFRINAEVTVSRLGYIRHKESFFSFRTKMFAETRRLGYPFKAYLEKYPDLQPEWSQIWKDKWPGMREWRRFNIQEPRPENRNAAHFQKAILSATAETGHPWGAHPARVARQRRQNERFLLSMVSEGLTPR